MLKVKAGPNNDVEFTAGSRRFKYVKRLSMLSTHCVSMDLTLPGVGVDKGARGVGGGVWSHSSHMCAHTRFSSFISFLPVPFLSPPPPSLSCPLSFSSASYFSFWAISLSFSILPPSLLQTSTLPSHGAFFQSSPCSNMHSIYYLNVPLLCSDLFRYTNTMMLQLPTV